MSIKILHTADLHIGKNYGSFNDYPEVKEDLIEERYQVLDRLVSKANENSCDLFVVAGDLFDNPNFRKKKDVEKISPHLKKFEGRAILILPGNHDYLSERNKDKWRWLEDIENVLVLKNKDKYDISDRLEEGNETCIYPAPCDQKISQENNLDWIEESEKEEDRFHIGIAHGHLEGCSYDEEGEYFPMTKDELNDRDMDLWLLGHVHVMIPRQETRIEDHFYPGTPEGDGFKRLAEESEKGKAWVIEIKDDKEISANSVDVGKHRFKYEEVNVEDMDDLEELKEYLEDDEHEDELLRLTVEGKMDKDDFEQAQEYINGLREDPKGFKYIEVDDEEFNRRIDLDVVRDEFSEGSFSYKLLEKILEEESELNETAAELAYEMIEEMRG